MSKDLYLNSFALLIIVVLVLFPPTSWAASTVAINELIVNPAGSDTNEWIELYSSDQNFSSPDYWIDDDNTLVVNNAVQTGGDDPGSDPVHLALDFHGSNFFVIPLSSYLNNTGDHPTLFLYQNGTAAVVDEYQYSDDPGDDVPLGRYPDGGPKASILASATKGSSNSPPPSPTGVPTAAPTRVPKPTSTPKPKAILVPTKEPPATNDSPNNLESATTSIKSPPPSASKNSSVLGVTSEPMREEPTPRLEVDTSSVQIESTPSGQTREPESSQTSAKPKLPLVLMILGGLLVLGAGIPLLIQEIKARTQARRSK